LGLMGGWAVTYLLNNRGIQHVGSRDIDIFYDPKCINHSFISELIRRQRFVPHSNFRWAKFFDRRTRKMISENESKRLNHFNLTTIYLDVAAPAPDEDQFVRDHVLDEPLLREVFDGKSEYSQSADSRILMPNIHVMVRIKTKSVLGRVDSFKREKDLVDLVAMVRNAPELWVQDDGFQVKLRSDLRNEHTLELKRRLDAYSRDGTLSNVANLLALDFDVVLEILRRM